MRGGSRKFDFFLLLLITLTCFNTSTFLVGKIFTVYTYTYTMYIYTYIYVCMYIRYPCVGCVIIVKLNVFATPSGLTSNTQEVKHFQLQFGSYIVCHILNTTQTHLTTHYYYYSLLHIQWHKFTRTYVLLKLLPQWHVA